MTAEGKAGVVRELLGDARAEYEATQRAAAGEQIGMFPVALRGRDRRDPARAAAIQREVEKRNAPGRPAGAQNLTTQEFKKWLFARGVSPLAALMRWAILPPDMLMRELGCTYLEAFREWKSLQIELAPYMHARLGFVDDEGKPVPHLTMVVGGQTINLQSGTTPWEMREAVARQMQENQAVTIDAAAQSQTGGSHGMVK